MRSREQNSLHVSTTARQQRDIQKEVDCRDKAANGTEEVLSGARWPQGDTGGLQVDRKGACSETGTPRVVPCLLAQTLVNSAPSKNI
jgi:hypothetical protein